MSRKVVFLAVPVVALVAWLDYFTPPEVRLYLLYLLPIVAVAWWGTERDAVVLAIFAMILATATDTPWHSSMSLGVLVWNAFSRIVLFMFGAVLVGELRDSRQRLASLDRDHKKAYGREAMLARTDALTSLPNLRSFLETIQRELARSVRDGSHLCVLYVDLDNFKTVNDQYGHQGGDAVLQEVAGALQSSVRGGDVVARIGGDEFVILLWHASPADARLVADRIAQRIGDIAEAYPMSRLDASIGMRYFDQPPTEADEVVRQADAAMYDEKQRRKSSSVR